MNTLSATEQWLLASLLGVFVVGSGILLWQEKKLDARLNNLAPVANAAAPALVASRPQRPARESSGAVISLTHAGAGELEQLPGIGPRLAEEIIRYRAENKLESVEDLLEVPGIGPKKLEKLRDRVKVD